jgi:uncharacterized protein involved in exopolysaccharide biosynthesis
VQQATSDERANVKNEIQIEETKNLPQSSQRDQGEPYEDDEINLLDLFMVLVRRKRLIIGLTFLTGVAAVIISLQMRNVYRSEATIAPRQIEQSGSKVLSGALGGLGGMVASEFGLGGGGEVDKIEVLLKSRQLVQLVVEKHNLMPLLFEEKWDAQKKAWSESPAPTMQDAYKLIKDGLLKVTRDRKTDVITVSIEHKNPGFARSVVDYYLTELSEGLRAKVLKDAQENMRFLREQLDRTTDPLLREKIYGMLAKEIEKDTFARAQTYYGFYVLDPPVAPDLNKKARPKRSMIFILSVVVAFFIAIFLAFFLEYLDRLKTQEPDRYQQLKDGLRLRRRKPKP